MSDQPDPTPHYYDISGGGPALTIVATSAAHALAIAAEHWRDVADADLLDWSWFEIEEITNPDTINIADDANPKRLTDCPIGTVVSEEF